MSSKSSKGKKHQFNVNEPRLAAEIDKEFAELMTRAATAQYRVYVHGVELEQLNQRILEVNNEGAARRSLDASEQEAGTNE